MTQEVEMKQARTRRFAIQPFDVGHGAGFSQPDQRGDDLFRQRPHDVGQGLPHRRRHYYRDAPARRTKRASTARSSRALRRTRCPIPTLTVAVTNSADGHPHLPRRPLQARPFADLIETVALKHGIDPALVHAVVQAESNYQPGARSHVGARGLMQVMPSTARDFGVTSARCCSIRRRISKPACSI